MTENSLFDTPENSYAFDSSIGRIRQADDAEELARWKTKIANAVNIYVFSAIPKFGQQLIGHVDSIDLSSNHIFISCWAPDGQLAVALSKRCDSLGYEVVERPDIVAETGSSDWLRSGFRITLKCNSSEDARIVASNLCVIVSAGTQNFSAVLENPSYSQCRKWSEGKGEWRMRHSE